MPSLPLAPKVADAIDSATMRAFLTGDEDRLREMFSLNPWDNGVLVDFDTNPGATLKTEGDARAHTLRLRIIAKIERLGKFRFSDLDADRDATRGRAWARLDRIAARIGVSAETWERISSRSAGETDDDGGLIA